LTGAEWLEHAPERTGQVVAALLVLIWFYSTWVTIRARRRQREGNCPRCGAAGPDTRVGDELFCASCAELTRTGHAFGFRFFVGLAVVGVAFIVLGTLSDIRHGFSMDPKVLLVFAGAGIVGPLALAFWIRRQVARRSNTRQDEGTGE
jgi:hypothetical protein